MALHSTEEKAEKEMFNKEVALSLFFDVWQREDEDC